MKLRTRLALTTILAGIPVLVGFWVLHQFFLQRLGEEVLAQFVLTHMQSMGRAECEARPEEWNYRGHGSLPADNPGGGFTPDSDIPKPGVFLIDDIDGPPHDKTPPPDEGFGSHREKFPPPGHGPRFGLFAYDLQFRSSNPNAPELDSVLILKIKENGSSAEREVKDDFFRHRPPNMPFPPELDGRRPPEDPKILEVLVKMPWEKGPCAYILARRPQPPSDGDSFEGFPPLQIWLFPVLFVLAVVLLSVAPIVRRTRQLTYEVREFARTAYSQEISVGGSDEIGELAQAFKDAGEEIRSHIASQEKREKTLRDFLDNTTHDVMIPLTVLQGHLSAMQEHLSAAKNIDAELLTSAMSESQYITSLIYNLSVAAKIEEGAPALQWEAVNLNRLVERVIGRHRPVARQKDISIDYAVPENPVWCDGDMTFIEQSVNNVVYNAIRHNLSGGHVAILLDYSGSDSFMLRVIDDGPGIPDDDLVRLLEKCRSENVARSREPGGHGLGMRIACQLASMHKWSFNLKRSEYGGLQVDFAGPRRDAPEA